MKTIFEPFTREKNTTVSRIEGTGLGMVITKNIVDMMGGTITVSSKPSVGSTFVVKLRFRTMDNKEEIDVIPGQFKGKRVLIVDDVELNREIATAVIKDAGLEVETAENGQAAIKTGMNDHLAKPVQMDELYKMMAMYLK